MYLLIKTTNQPLLEEAAVQMAKLLDDGGVRYALFGGLAVSALGGPRGSKDVDCLAGASKERLVQILDKHDGFAFSGNNRPDYIMFFWKPAANSRESILVELFPAAFNGPVSDK